MTHYRSGNHGQRHSIGLGRAAVQLLYLNEVFAGAAQVIKPADRALASLDFTRVQAVTYGRSPPRGVRLLQSAALFCDWSGVATSVAHRKHARERVAFGISEVEVLLQRIFDGDI